MTYNDLIARLAPLYGRQEAQAVVRTVLDALWGMSLTDICCGKVTQLSAEDATRLDKIMRRLEKSEPVQYALGEAWFAGRRFGVGPSVLIPRPETEGLAAWAADTGRAMCAAGGTPGQPRPLSVLDIGTGSGCLAVTLALDMPGASVTAWDISPRALDIARDNARRLAAPVSFVLQDALHAPHDSCRWHVVVSNPPYICERERASMHANVLGHEPHTALFVPDDDPLLFYRAIARYAAAALVPGGALLFETNTLYAADVARLMEREGLERAEVRPDCFGRPRMVRAFRGDNNK